MSDTTANFRIYLRAFEADDYVLINKWRNDRSLQHMTAGTFRPTSSDTDKAWVQEKMKYSQNELYCSICLKEGGEMIGYSSLNDIELVHKKCLWGGIVIGEKKAAGKNIAFEVGFLFLQYAFDELNLERVYTYLIENNTPSLNLVNKLNFTREGTYRRSIYKNGEWYSQAIFGLLKNEFKEFCDNLPLPNQQNTLQQ